MSRYNIIGILSIFLIAIDSTNSLYESAFNFLQWKAGGLKFIEEFYRYCSMEYPDTTPKHGQEYDFIVVGAGSAGATLAARLSEHSQSKVLLIEAGGHEDLVMDVPLMALFLQLNKDINWGYQTEPSMDYCRGTNNNQCNIHKGKVMGGTSTTNFMIATRGNKRDYDEWYKMTGDPGWSYKGMLKYFKKLETCDVNMAAVDPNLRGFDGPIRIANPPFHSKLATAFIRAGEEMGFPPLDYNGAKQTGFSYIQTNQINGERLSTNRAYLHPIKNRTNLFLTMNSLVTKVMIDRNSRTAFGVEFLKNGRRLQVRARKEVILTAGAISTPQILMLSGIGPARHLKKFDIEVLQNLPVGENMMDHIAYGGLFFTVNESVSIVVPEFLNPNNPTIGDYLTRRTGFFATPGGVEGLGYINVDDLNPDNEEPNIELMFGSVSITSDELIHVPFGVSDYHWKKFFADKLHKHAYIIMPLLMKPKSRGKIKLRSRDPKDKPRLLANYFTDPDDIRVAILGIRSAIEVSKTQAMKRYNAQMHNYTVPGCENFVMDSDEYWECALRTFTVTLWHHSGTCKMGRESDKTTVVNTKGQVKGINRLRVADASVFPNIPTAHINIPVIATAEKFADIILAYWGYV